MTEIITESNFENTLDQYKELKKQMQPLIKGANPLTLLLVIMIFGGIATEAQLMDFTDWSRKTVQRHFSKLELYDYGKRTQDYHKIKYMLGPAAKQLDFLSLDDQSGKLLHIDLSSSSVKDIKDLSINYLTTTTNDESGKLSQINPKVALIEAAEAVKHVFWECEHVDEWEAEDPRYELLAALTIMGVGSPTNLSIACRPGMKIETVNYFSRQAEKLSLGLVISKMLKGHTV